MATTSETQIKHYCVSCGQNLSIYGGPAGVCDHGLLCEVCRYESECPQCSLAEEQQRDIEDLATCAKAEEDRDSGDADDFRDNYFTRSN